MFNKSHSTNNILMILLFNSRSSLGSTEPWSGQREKKYISRPRFTSLSAQNIIACAQDTICISWLRPFYPHEGYEERDLLAHQLFKRLKQLSLYTLITCKRIIQNVGMN